MSCFLEFVIMIEDIPEVPPPLVAIYHHVLCYICTVATQYQKEITWGRDIYLSHSIRAVIHEDDLGMSSIAHACWSEKQSKGETALCWFSPLYSWATTYVCDVASNWRKSASSRASHAWKQQPLIPTMSSTDTIFVALNVNHTIQSFQKAWKHWAK